MATKQQRDEFFDRIQGGDFVRGLLLVMCKHAPSIGFGSDGKTKVFNVRSFSGQCTEEMYNDFKDLIPLLHPEHLGTGMFSRPIILPNGKSFGSYNVSLELPIEPYLRTSNDVLDFFTLFINYCMSIGIDC